MLILTANANQAFRLSQSKAYPRAEIYAWDQWLAKAFVQKFPDQRILKALELETLWQACVRQGDAEGAISVEPLARMAQEAWWLMRHWQIPFSRLTQSYSENTQWFAKVAKTFEAYCKKNQCIDEASALVLLTRDPISTEVSLYGFFDLTLLQKGVFTNLTSLAPTGRGIEGEGAFGGTEANSGSKAFITFETPDEELDAALDWAIAEQQQNPTQKIAVVVPELAKLRGRIEGIFNAQPEGSVPYSIALPAKLAEQGAIQTAYLLLTESLFSSFELETLVRLLRSPFWGEMPAQQIDRAGFLLKLRELQLERFDLDTLIQLSEPWPSLQAWLNTLYQKPQKKAQALEAWAEQWKNLLTSLQFSLEENSWKILMEALAQYFPWQEKFSAQGALNFLKRLSQKTHFPESAEEKSGIRILGVVDAIDQSFDQLWLVDAVQGKIPFPLYVNPLIDKKLQREAGVWALDTALQDQWAEKVFVDLQRYTQQLTISYSKECEGKINLPALFFNKNAGVGWTKRSVSTISDVEYSEKKPSNPLFPWQQKSIPGATAAVKSQRLCSMQAFARFRLGLEELPEPTLGLTPIERGLIVHRALHLIWQQLQTQEVLLAMPAEALAQLINKVIPLSLKSVPWLRRKLLPNALLELEFSALKNNLTEWLALEAERPPFRVVAMEKESQVVFKGFQWRLRVDRIDALEDGRLLLIDYKTGSVSTKNWQPEIFTEPQLPLYAVTSEEPLAGIAFAEVVNKNLRITGIAKEDISLGKIGFLKATDDWQDLLAQWKVALEYLVDEFVRSEVELNPLEADLTCGRCGLQTFCRIFERGSVVDSV